MFLDMEQEQKEKEHKSRGRIIIRRIRPRYKKILIPFLIISLIVAIILIVLLNKYFFKPIFEGKGFNPGNNRKALVKTENKPEKIKVHFTKFTGGQDET
jgi:predicted membrane protein